MRQEEQQLEQETPVETVTPSLPESDVDEPMHDWRELGRRVLGEAMRRSARDLRRRNGCTVYNTGLRRGSGSRS